jgi:UPF0271 protein
MRLDLNCDLGEGEPMARTRALMRWITSANVACGGHAGDVESMHRCARLAQEFGVRLGAHPGPWSRDDFGRGTVGVTPEQLELILLHQVSALAHVARGLGMPLHHIKLHGALYHASEQSRALARRYGSVVARWWPGVKIYARAGGLVAAAARHAGVEVWEEAFADRAYRDDGTLVSRAEPGALLTSTTAVLAQVKALVRTGAIITLSGRRLAVRARTLCLHSDTPNAPALARAVSRLLDES